MDTKLLSYKASPCSHTGNLKHNAIIEHQQTWCVLPKIRFVQTFVLGVATKRSYLFSVEQPTLLFPLGLCLFKPVRWHNFLPECADTKHLQVGRLQLFLPTTWYMRREKNNLKELEQNQVLVVQLVAALTTWHGSGAQCIFKYSDNFTCHAPKVIWIRLGTPAFCSK